MLDLAAVARRLRNRGHLLRLRDPRPDIMALIELTGLHRLPGVRVETSTVTLS
jgi:anti-anti-sigma regulatory factor